MTDEERTRPEAETTETAEAERADGEREATKPADPGLEAEREEEAASPPPEEDWKTLAESRWDQLLRLKADFENFRRRVDRDRADSQAETIGRLLTSLLPVYDNLERALRFMPNEGEAKAWRVGVEMTLNGFNEALARLGVTPVETGGQRFDPRLHEAVQQVESELPEGTVVEEVQKGFQWGDRVLRAALVKVSSGAPGEAGEGPQSPESES